MLHSPALKTDMMLMDGVKMFKKAYLAPNQRYLRFGENVRALQREKHLSQEELSEMVLQRKSTPVILGCSHLRKQGRCITRIR